MGEPFNKSLFLRDELSGDAIPVLLIDSNHGGIGIFEAFAQEIDGDDRQGLLLSAFVHVMIGWVGVLGAEILSEPLDIPGGASFLDFDQDQLRAAIREPDPGLKVEAQHLDEIRRNPGLILDLPAQHFSPVLRRLIFHRFDIRVQQRRQHQPGDLFVIHQVFKNNVINGVGDLHTHLGDTQFSIWHRDQRLLSFLRAFASSRAFLKQDAQDRQDKSQR